MLATTTNDLPGYKIVQVIGMVRGLTVRAPTISQGLFGGLQKMFGGNISAYVKMCEQGREDAYNQMCQHAAQMGANAVLSVRYDSGDLDAGGTAVTEILCYGTAVRMEPI